MIIVLAGSFSISAKSQCVKDNNHLLVAAFGFSNESTGIFSLDYHYMLFPWFGIGGGLVNSYQLKEDILPNGDYQNEPFLHWSSETRVTTPCIKLSTYLMPFSFYAGSCRFMISFESGTFVSPLREVQTIKSQNVQTGIIDYMKIHKNADKWLNWFIIPGIFVQKKGLGVGIEYSISDFDHFYTARKLSFEGCSFEKFYPTYTGLVHTLQICTSYSF